MEQTNREMQEPIEQAAAPAQDETVEPAEAVAPVRSVASERLLSYTQNATEDEKIILEQMASTTREPRVTAIGKKASAKLGVVLIALCIPIMALGLFLIPAALPLLLAGSVMLVLMGAWRISNRKKRPCICPYCAYFDDIPDNTVDYTCSRCGNESTRIGDELHPKGPRK